MWRNIYSEMLIGNFSFAILVFAILQTILMFKNTISNTKTKEILKKKHDKHKS